MFINTKLTELNNFRNFLSLLIMSLTFTTQASVITYQPNEEDAKDAWVQSSHAGVGNNEVLHVWKSNAIGGFKSLYQVPNIPSSGNSANSISSATLNLYVIDTEGGGHSSHAPGFEGLSMPIKVTAMANPWAEDTLVGGSTDAIQFWEKSISADESATAQINLAGEDVGNWISLDVTEHVRSWINYSSSNGTEGLPYYGFLIEATQEIRASDGGLILAAFHSSGALNPLFRPYVEITTVPLPGTVWLLGASLMGLMQFNKKTKKTMPFITN